ncbi:MAG: hypothetical protein QM731_27040 [Chitinophagaceae bacterium]
MKRTHSFFIKEDNLVVTELSGELDSNDIEEWQLSLKNVINSLEAHSKFKILVNLHGFKAQNFDAHKKFRVIIPLTLADYGWYVGYLRMFPEAAIMIHAPYNIHCIAAAHVHHDESKISNYAKNYTMINEGFFTDPLKAREWINGIIIQ